MQIVLLGNGAREHALARWFAQSHNVKCVHWLGHNGAPPEEKLCAVSADFTDPRTVAQFCGHTRPDLVLSGGESPLCAGVGDAVRSLGIAFYGPGREAAQLEGSKIFAKQKMTRWGVPTAAWHRAENFDSAREFLHSRPDSPWVVKADGLAAGKGVIIAENRDQALNAARSLIEGGTLGTAGSRLVIEEFLQGEEISVHVLLCSDTTSPWYRILPVTQDHKRAGEGDTGPNTGGMGAYGPVPAATREVIDMIDRQILHPVLEGLRADKLPYRGTLYVGAMLTAQGPRVLEFNCRFGDPECQVLVNLLDNDAVEMLGAVALGEPPPQLRVKSGAAACVVLAAEGYPESPRKGDEIHGLDQRLGCVIYHAGTRRENGRVLTNGGRVLSVVKHAESLPTALAAIYDDIKKISFRGMYYRRDIGHRALSGAALH